MLVPKLSEKDPIKLKRGTNSHTWTYYLCSLTPTLAELPLVPCFLHGWVNMADLRGSGKTMFCYLPHSPIWSVCQVGILTDCRKICRCSGPWVPSSATQYQSPWSVYLEYGVWSMYSVCVLFTSDSKSSLQLVHHLDFHHSSIILIYRPGVWEWSVSFPWAVHTGKNATVAVKHLHTYTPLICPLDHSNTEFSS